MNRVPEGRLSTVSTGPNSAELEQQLAELGYIEKPGEDKQVGVAHTVRELQFNLARDYFGAARHPEAIRRVAVFVNCGVSTLAVRWRMCVGELLHGPSSASSSSFALAGGLMSETGSM